MLNQRSPNNLKKIRTAEGLTIAEVVEISRVSRTTVKNLEEGKIDSKPETKQKIVNSINNHPNRTQKREYAFEDIFPYDTIRCF